MEVQEWLGADNQLGLDIWQNKYRDDSETFDAWLDRVSGGDDAAWLTEALKTRERRLPFPIVMW